MNAGDGRGYPIVRLEVERMGEMLQAAYAVHAEAISKEVEAAVSDVVKNFNFDGYVRQAARPIIEKSITDAIQMYFWGEGRKILDEAVRVGLAAAAKKGGSL